MSTSLEKIKDELKERVRFYPIIIQYTDNQFRQIVKDAAMRLYIDLGRDSQFETDYIEFLVDEGLETEHLEASLNKDISISEREYILISAEIGFLHSTLGDVATIVSYSTDALSVSNADKPFKYLSEVIDKLESRLTELFYKITSQQS